MTHHRVFTAALVAAASAVSIAALPMTLLKAGRAPVSAGPAAYELLYTDAGDCDPPGDNCVVTHFPIPFWLKRASFDSAGSLLASSNVTAPQNGMGYIYVHPNHTLALFATEDEATSNVNTFTVDLATGTTNLFLSDLSLLLAPCTPRCNQASTFYATFSPDASAAYFSYWPWDNEGNAIGRQSIGMSDANGGGAVPLTYNLTDVDTSDECPQGLPGGRIHFTRSYEQGVMTWPAVVDITTGATTVMSQLPQVAVASGCPVLLNSSVAGDTIMYLACMGADSDCSFLARAPGTAGERLNKAQAGTRWGHRGVGGVARTQRGQRRGQGGRPASLSTRLGDPTFAYVTVHLPVGLDPATANYTLLFPVPLVDSPDYLDTFAITQCDKVYGGAAGGPLSCEGANATADTFARVLVNPKTGASIVDSGNTLLACMTPHCSLLMLPA